MKKFLSAILAVVMILSAAPICRVVNPDFNITSISASAAQLNGLNKTNGKWYYYKNGKIDKSFEGMAKNQYGWWYVKNGTIDFTYTGMAKNQYGWWYMKNGKLDTTYTGMAKNQYGKRWVIVNGKATQSSKNTITAKTKNVKIVEGNYVDITLNVYAPDGFEYIYYDYYKGSSSIVSCEWGSWNGDYTSITIRIYGNNPGKETVIFYFDGQKNDVKESINVTVTENQPNYSLQLPECPISVYCYVSKHQPKYLTRITDIKCQIDQNRSSMYADLTITGTKIYDVYDDGSNCDIAYKLYNENGVVVDSGVFSSPKVSEGESFIINASIYGSNLVPGKYRLEIIDLYL